MKRMFLLVIFLSHLMCGSIILQEQDSKEYTVTVDSTNLRFYPDSLTINEGDSVRFLWGGEFLPHNSVEENGIFNSGDPEREVDYLYTFDYTQSGVYNFFCEPHESVGMDGTITVLDKIETQNIEVLNSGDDENKIIPLFIYSGIVILLIIIYYRVRISGIERL
jgi:plastocyanin